MPKRESMPKRLSLLPRKLLLTGLLGILGGVGLALYWFVFGRGESLDLPPVADSKFLNTHASALYVGNQQCADCHTDQHRSYLQTTHSRSIVPIDLGSAPGDADFDQPGSLRRYRPPSSRTRWCSWARWRRRSSISIRRPSP